MSIAGRRELFFGTTIGKTYNFEEGTYSDDGTAIALRVRTKQYSPLGVNNLIEIQRIFARADEPQGGYISFSLDGGDYEHLGQIWETKEPQRFDFWKECYTFRVGLDEVSSNNIIFKGFVVQYQPKTKIL